jgi:hypothetical protein
VRLTSSAARPPTPWSEQPEHPVRPVDRLIVAYGVLNPQDPCLPVVTLADHPEWTMPARGGLHRILGYGAGPEATIGVAWSYRPGKDATMSTGNRSDDEFRPSSAGEDTATRFTRGVVDGFTEASQAFSHELEGANRFPELMGRSLAGVIRANARLLDEVANVVRQAADEWGERPRRAEDDFDYERLAEMVAARLGATTSGTGDAEPRQTSQTRRKT